MGVMFGRVIRAIFSPGLMVLLSVSAAAPAETVKIQTVAGLTVIDRFAVVPPHESFRLTYDVSLPAEPPADMSFNFHYFYRNGKYLTKTSRGEGLGWAINHPASLALAVGEHEILEICIGDVATLAQKPQQYCQSVVIQSDVSRTTLDLHYVQTANLGDGYNYVGCAAFGCAFYQDVFFGSDHPWINDYRVSPDFPGPRGEPAGYHRNNLTFDYYYPGTGDAKIDSSSPKTLIILGHPANKTKEIFRVDYALAIEFLIDNNYAVAAVDFRHPLKEFDAYKQPIAKDDMARTVQFFKQYASEFNINPNKIVLAGTSLGGGMAVYTGFRELRDISSADPIARQSSRVAGVWGYDASTSFSPTWVRQNFLEAPTPTTPAELNAYYCYYSYLEDYGNLQLFGHALDLVDAAAPKIGLYYADEPVDLSEHKLTVEDVRYCPDNTSSGTYDLVHLPNFAEAMIDAYQAQGVGDRIATAYGQPITQYYYDLVGFVNGL
tara:strand:- start:155 stop:1627 length:1473 start_codon:yes stop_codon:yes gene_type:complete